MSSKALHLMHAPMLDVADNLREEYGRALVRVLDVMLRLCATKAAREGGVLLASWEAALPALDGRTRTRTDGRATWLPVPLKLTWGEYFEPSWSDVTAAVTAARTGVEGGVLSRAQAVRMIAPVVGVSDVDEELEAVTSDADASASAMRNTLSSLDAPPSAESPAAEATETDDG
jgi:hypothetical protein